MDSVRIVGIDPGFDRLGIAVIDKQGTTEILIHSSCIVTSRKDLFEKRLRDLAKELALVFKKYKPSELAMEKLFFAKNQTTAIHVAEVRGVCLYLADRAGLSIHEYSPPQVKLAIAGHGGASKHDIARMVPKILKGGALEKLLDDEMDAIAIALTHSAHRKRVLWK